MYQTQEQKDAGLDKFEYHLKLTTGYDFSQVFQGYHESMWDHCYAVVSRRGFKLDKVTQRISLGEAYRMLDVCDEIIAWTTPGCEMRTTNYDSAKEADSHRRVAKHYRPIIEELVDEGEIACEEAELFSD